MNHKKKFNHLSRTSAHRKAMLSNMAASLILNKRISTTVPKAKALKIHVEPLNAKSKNDNTNSRAVVPPPGPGAPGAGGLPLPGQLPALLRPLPPVPAPAGPGYPDPGLRQLPRPGPRLVPRRRETPPGKPSPAGGDRRGS